MSYQFRLHFCRTVYSLAVCSAMFGATAQAAPQRVRVDGVLATSAGLPTTGSRDILIRAYDASTAGTLLWTSSVTEATLTEGRFSIVLDASSGGTNSLMNKVSELSSTGELWFDVTIDTGASGNGSIDTAAVVAPRIRSKGVMYALASSRASTADQIRGTTVDSALAPTSGQVLTYDGTKWIGATVASGGGNFVAITGSTMTGALRVPTGSSATNVGLQIGGATNGLYMDAATLRLVSGGNTQLRLSNTDNAAIFTGALGFLGAENTGIFSAAPNMSLRVGGTVILNLSSTQIRANGAGSVSAPMWTNVNDLDTGIFQPGNGNLSLTTDGTERLRATSTGVVTFGSVSLSGTGSHLVLNSTDNAASKIAFVDSSRQLISSTAATSQTELAYLVGVTAPIQTQIAALGSPTGFVAITGSTMTGALVAPTLSVTSATASRIAYLDSSKNITSTTATVTQAELQYLSGVTSAIQTQIGNRVTSSQIMGPINCGFAVDVNGTSSLIFSTKQADGTSNFSVSNPCLLSFRATSITATGYSQQSITVSSSSLISNGYTLGSTTNDSRYIHIYYAYDSANSTVRPAWSLDGFKSESSLHSVSAMIGTANNPTAIFWGWSSTSNVPVRYIGRFKAPQSAAGAWVTSPTERYMGDSPSYAMTDWIDGGTSTILGLSANPVKGTVQVDKIWYRRVGDSMDIRWQFSQTTTSSAGSGNYYLVIPGNYQIDTNKVTAWATNKEYLSVGTMNAIPMTIGETGIGPVFVTGVTTLSARLGYVVPSSDQSRVADWASDWFGMNNSTIRITLQATVPIVGWSTGQ